MDSPVYAQIEQNDIPQDSLPELNLENDFQDRFFKALAERGIENYDKAIDLLINIEEEVKDEPVVYYQMGLNYFDLEQFDLAQLNLEKARTLKPDDEDITEAVFNVKLKKNMYQSAIAEAAKLSKTNFEYLEVIASLYLKLQNFDKALFYLYMSEQALGYSVGKDNMREEIYRDYQNHDKAIKYYKERQDNEPYNPYNLYRLAYYQLQNNQLNEALMSLEKLKAQHPLFTKAYVLETDIHLKNNQPDKAFETLKVVVNDRFLEEIYKVEAIEYVKAFVAKNPEYREQFIQVLDMASQQAEDSATNLDLGLYYYDTDKPKSLVNFKKALEQNPQDYEILKRISILEYQLGRYEEALQTAEESLEIYPTQVVFMLVKANVLAAQTQYNEAKSVLEEAEMYIFEENEVMLMLYESLSQVYRGLGEAEQAKTYQNKADNLKSKLN